MSVVEMIDDLRRRGFELIPDPPAIRVRHPSRDVAEASRPLLDELRAKKNEALEILTSTTREDEWYDERARQRLVAAFDWADETTPPGCWTSLDDDVRANLQGKLDAAFDVIDQSFHDQDPAAFEAGLARFREVVEAAAAEYERDGDELMEWFDEEGA